MADIPDCRECSFSYFSTYMDDWCCVEGNTQNARCRYVRGNGCVCGPTGTMFVPRYLKEAERSVSFNPKLAKCLEAIVDYLKSGGAG